MTVPIRFSAILIAVLGVFVTPGISRADIININDLRQQGLATLTASQWDIGHMDALFDRDWSNLYRSAAINPAIVTVEFVDAHESGAMRILCAADSEHEVILDAADTMADLENQTGSYVRILDQVIVGVDQIGWWEWNESPVTRRIFRWSVERLTRDDYVHIREIEFQTAEPVEEVDIGGEIVRINVIEVQPDLAQIPIGQLQQFDAEGSLSYGPNRYDVTELAAWSAGDPGVARLDGAGLLTGIGAGTTAVNADIGVVHGEAQLDVRVVRPVDLNVGFIHRTPEFNRFKVVFNGDQRIDPAYMDEPKWPAPGELVTYTAHIFNKGDLPAFEVGYRWLFDGLVVEEGTIPQLDAGQAMQLAYAAAWPDDVVQTVDVPPGAHTLDPPQLERAIGEHLITLELDPGDAIEEGSELNNVVTDPINALSFWFYMDQSTYERFSSEKSFLETYSPEDWARGQLLGLERRLWISDIQQRLRMDMLMVVADGELNPGGVHEPFGTETRQADSRWGFSWPDWYVARYAKVVEHALIHELGHQLGLIDIYQYDIATQNCLITHDGQLVADTDLMPRVSPWNVYYGNIRIFNDGGVPYVDGTPRGTMASPGAAYFARSSVSGMNRNFGLRRGFFGDYLGAVQQGQISLRVTHAGDEPVGFAFVRVFQREFNSTVPDVPKFTGATDAFGVMPFPDHTRPEWHGGIDVNNPWSFEHDGVFYNAPDPVGRNAPLIVELIFDDGGQDVVEYHFVEVDELNMAMGQGILDDYTIELVTHHSRRANQLPDISFNGTPEDVDLDEGEAFEALITAVDPDGDEVSLSMTPRANTEFDPATGVFRFTPDSLQVSNGPEHWEYMAVDFIADDGKFAAVRQMRFHVSDVDDYAWIGLRPGDDPCVADFNDDGIVNTLDFLSFLNAYNVGDMRADVNGDGILNTLDFLAFLNEYNAGC